MPNVAGELLKPETGKQYEVGVKYQPVGINALITLAAFDLTRSNVVTYAPPNYFAEQTGEVSSRGIELEGTATLAEGFNVRGGYAYLDNVVTKDPVNVGKTLTTVPLNRLSLWADYTVQSGPFAGVQVGGGIRYVGATFGDDDNTFTVPASTALDALVAYTQGQLSAGAQRHQHRRHPLCRGLLRLHRLLLCGRPQGGREADLSLVSGHGEHRQLRQQRRGQRHEINLRTTASLGRTAHRRLPVLLRHHRRDHLVGSRARRAAEQAICST